MDLFYGYLAIGVMEQCFVLKLSKSAMNNFVNY